MNDTPSQQVPPQPAPPRQPRTQRGAVIALLVAASILAFVATFAVWVNRQLLETDTWTNTSSKLLEDPEIQSQVADFMVNALYANVDVQAELQQALPPRLQPLAGPAAAGLRQLATNLANRALESPRFQELWENANREAQETLVNVVEEGGSEPVTLDVGTLVNGLGEQLGVDVAGKVPPDIAQIQIASNEKLVKADEVLKVLKAVAVFATLLALALFGLAIYLAEGWRREALRAVGFAFIAVGILVLAVRSIAGNAIVNSLSTTESVQPAASSAWSIGTALLRDQGGGLIVYGLVIVLGAWLAGSMGIARSVRRTITPLLENRLVGYTTLGLILILLFAWSPTPGFSRVPTGLLLILLMVAGFEALRHRAVADFPGETWDGATERWGESLRRQWERRKRST
jgi:hypothetical protein